MFLLQALTLVKTCEPVAEMRECRGSRDWSLLALQNVRTGKSHYLVICRCPDTNILGKQQSSNFGFVNISSSSNWFQGTMKWVLGINIFYAWRFPSDLLRWIIPSKEHARTLIKFWTNVIDALRFINKPDITFIYLSIGYWKITISLVHRESWLTFPRRGTNEPRSTDLRQRPGHSSIRNDVRAGKQKRSTAAIRAQHFRYANYKTL